jgi:hypothetical protein
VAPVWRRAEIISVNISILIVKRYFRLHFIGHEIFKKHNLWTINIFITGLSWSFHRYFFRLCTRIFSRSKLYCGYCWYCSSFLLGDTRNNCYNTFSTFLKFWNMANPNFLSSFCTTLNQSIALHYWLLNQFIVNFTRSLLNHIFLRSCFNKLLVNFLI